jgi:hypothetical protein
VSDTKILRCGCKNRYQDREHGKRMRVHNEALKAWRCTVCSSEKPKERRREVTHGQE